MQKIRSATSIKKFTFFLTDDLPCLIEQYLALFGVKKSIAAAIFELKKNPRMEVCVWPFRRPPCGDFFFAQKLWPLWIFLHCPIFDDRTLISR
jgi:hypothetical protein